MFRDTGIKMFYHLIFAMDLFRSYQDLTKDLENNHSLKTKLWVEDHVKNDFNQIKSITAAGLDFQAILIIFSHFT